MVPYRGRTFEINGIVFREIYNETTGSLVFYSKQECYDYAYRGKVNTISCSYESDKTATVRKVKKKNNAIPPKRGELKF